VQRANLVSSFFALANLNAIEYEYARENIPEIRVMGETPFWNADLEEEPNEDDAVLLESVGEEGKQGKDPHEKNVSTMDDSENVEFEVRAMSTQRGQVTFTHLALRFRNWRNLARIALPSIWFTSWAFTFTPALSVWRSSKRYAPRRTQKRRKASYPSKML
jgi:hypothetical protein